MDYLELERVHDAARAELREELERDTDLESPLPQLALPYPGLGQRGGRCDRKPPQLTLLVDCAAPQPTRIEELETGWEDAPTEALAQRVLWATKHRGRPSGLSPEDYGAQREWTVARSLTWQFFQNCRELPSAPIVWRDRFGDAAVVLGFLRWARRLGRHGITLSGPQWASVLGVSVPTVWRYLQRLERAGYLIRMRRWKPGRGGLPVALAANWYGLGPQALATLAALDEPASAVARARLKVRRKHLRAEGRRRGVPLVAGETFPPLEEYLDLALRACVLARTKDAERYTAFLAGDVPEDYTTAPLPTFVLEVGSLAESPQVELDGPDIIDVQCHEAPEPVELAALEVAVALAGELNHRGLGVDQELPKVLPQELERGVGLDGQLVPPHEQEFGHTPERRAVGAGIRARLVGPRGDSHAGRHARLVARRMPFDQCPTREATPGRGAFEARAAHPSADNSDLRAGVFSRDLRSAAPAIPISPRDGSPLGVLKPKRTGPQARDEAALRASPEPRQPPATAQGLLAGSDSAGADVLFAAHPHFARLMSSTGILREWAILYSGADKNGDTPGGNDGDEHKPNTDRDLRTVRPQSLDVREVDPPGAGPAASGGGAPCPGWASSPLLDD